MDTKTAGRAGAGLIVLFCFFIAFLEGYDIQSFGVAAPKLIPEFGLNPCLLYTSPSPRDS